MWAAGCAPERGGPVGLTGAGASETGSTIEAGDTADSAGETPDWDASPPEEVGSTVTFATECALVVGVWNLSWELVDPAAHDWIRSDATADAPVLADWLPMECFPVLEHPAHLSWQDDGAIEWAQIHRASPADLEGTWLGVAAIGELPSTEECQAIFDAYDAAAPTLRLTRVFSEAP